MKLTILGYPNDIGGASTECWHTVKLWRQLGIDVTLIPTWRCPDSWRTRLDSIGAKTLRLSPADVHLENGVCVGFCNHHFVRLAPRLHARGCRLVWVPCMNWITDPELRYLADDGHFDRWVFQTAFQRATWDSILTQFGEDGNARQIRGAFDVSEFPFTPRPYQQGEPFVVGRVSRPDPTKFSPFTWQALASIPMRTARIMGWTKTIEKKVGPIPPWAEVLSPGKMPAREFLAGCHALCQLNGEAIENWPRVGLEAMASGVPIVADARGGWSEMIRDGVSGYLVNTPEEAGDRLTAMAGKEPRRLAIAAAARARVEMLADPDETGKQWLKLLGELAA